jgi:hypothetical protein
VIALDDIVNGAITSRITSKRRPRLHRDVPPPHRRRGGKHPAARRRRCSIVTTGQAIDGALHKLDDPLFGKPRDERYAALRRRIARDSKARGRPPLTSDAAAPRSAPAPDRSRVAVGLYSVGRRVRDALVALVHVIAPARNCSCIGCTKSFCFATISLVNTWQWRQFSELFALYSAHTSFAIRAAPSRTSPWSR